MKIQRMISMEFLGTAILAVAIVGSGHMAINLQADSGMVLLINALATELVKMRPIVIAGLANDVLEVNNMAPKIQSGT